MTRAEPHSWIEISRAALTHNIQTFRGLLGPERRLMVVVKANAYGHGLLEVAPLALAAGANWLAVFSIDEAFALRRAEIDAPILVFGPTPADALEAAAEEGIRITIANPNALETLLSADTQPLRVHLKLETGTHRQGFAADDLAALEELNRAAGAGRVIIEGAYTHFADIEDTTDHSFAREQLDTFRSRIDELAARDIAPPVLHTACSAAALLFENTYFDMARVGISAYGMWPSRETLVSVKQSGREPVNLRPVMSWKTRIAEIKTAPVGATVGYGRTFKATRPTRLAILPVGYANGYDRHLSGRAFVLIRGQRAALCGRVMMNMIVADVTDVAGAEVGDEVVLLGRQGDEEVSAETMAGWLDTINYEVVTRAEPGGARRVV